MARSRRIEQGQATRRDLVAIATRLFVADGYARTSIEAVLREAGISRGALYHHFSGKEALFEAVLEQVEADIATKVAAAARDAADPVEALRAGCHAWLRLARDPTVRRIVLVDALSVVGWEKWRALDEPYAFGLMKGALAAVATTGGIRTELIDVLAHMLLAALTEVALVIARAKDSRAAVRAGQAAVDAMLDGLFGGDPPRSIR
jgi:AcrR family transcriptional regulator